MMSEARRRNGRASAGAAFGRVLTSMSHDIRRAAGARKIFLRGEAA